MASRLCLIDVKWAVMLREIAKHLGTEIPKGAFMCVRCGCPMVPMGGQVQRFEHWDGNAGCSGEPMVRSEEER